MASASTVAVEAANVMSDAMAYRIRKEILTGKYRSGTDIDGTTLATKRSQFAAWEAARGPVRVITSKWCRELSSAVRADGGATRALVTSEAVETRAALAPIAEDVRAVMGVQVAIQDMLMGKETLRQPGQTAKARLKELRRIKGKINEECMDLCEEEAVRKRDLLGETSAGRAACRLLLSCIGLLFGSSKILCDLFIILDLLGALCLGRGRLLLDLPGSTRRRSLTQQITLSHGFFLA